MSQTVTLATGTWLRLGERLVQILAPVSTLIPGADVNNLDAVAEILRASARQVIDPTGASAANLPLNAAIVNRQITAGAALEGGYAAGTALDITYGANGEKLYTSKGPVPANPTNLVQTAAPGASVIAVTFAEQINSALANYLLGFTCKVAAVNRVINAAALQGGNLKIHLTLASPVTTGQAVLLSFDSTLSDIKNLLGAKVQSFTDLAVVNTT